MSSWRFTLTLGFPFSWGTFCINPWTGFCWKPGMTSNGCNSSWVIQSDPTGWYKLIQIGGLQESHLSNDGVGYHCGNPKNATNFKKSSSFFVAHLWILQIRHDRKHQDCLRVEYHGVFCCPLATQGWTIGKPFHLWKKARRLQPWLKKYFWTSHEVKFLRFPRTYGKTLV